MKKRIVFSVITGIILFSIITWSLTAATVYVGFLFNDRDSMGTVVSRQALQSVVLAMEYFNSRSSSRKYVPLLLDGSDINGGIRLAAQKDAAAVIGGTDLQYPLLLPEITNSHDIAVISLEPGSLLARGNDFVFRPRPESGGHELGLCAKERGISAYAAIVSGFESSYVQEFIRDFESGAGIPPKRTLVFSGDLNKIIENFERTGRGMDAVLLVLPDWLAAIAIRELRLRTPHLEVFASNRAVSHRTQRLAGVFGEGLLTAASLPSGWNTHPFTVFVRETYGDHIPPVTLSMGYDAVAMLDEAISIAGSNNMKKVASVLKQLQELSLSHGKIAMDRNGDLLLPVSLLSLGEKGWTPFTRSSSAALSRIAAHGAEQ